MFLHVNVLNQAKDAKEFVNPNGRYLVLAGEDFDFLNLEEYIDAIWMGAVFPKIFNKTSLYSDKAFLCTLQESVHLDWIYELEDDFVLSSKSYMVFVNGLESFISSKLEDIFSNTPHGAVMFGAGAGRSTMDSMQCLYNGKNYVNSGIVMLSSDNDISIGVKHGYEVENDFHIITNAKGNMIYSIDNKSAFNFYQDILKYRYNIDVNKDNIFEIGLKYPLMFNVTYGEDIVRIPVKTDGEIIWSVGEIEQNSFVAIGKTKESALLEAAKESSLIAKNNLNHVGNTCFVVECFGRFAYSMENFKNELNEIKNQMKDLNLYGILSMGEIANTSKLNLEFYNSTCVIGAL
jgi:hypothetical protein